MRGQINNSNNRQNSHKQVTYHIVLETSNSFDKDGTPLSKGFLVNSNLARATKSSHLRLISILAQAEKSPKQMLWLGMREVSGVKERTPIMFQSNTTTTGSTPKKDNQRVRNKEPLRPSGSRPMIAPPRPLTCSSDTGIPSERAAFRAVEVMVYRLQICLLRGGVVVLLAWRRLDCEDRYRSNWITAYNLY